MRGSATLSRVRRAPGKDRDDDSPGDFQMRLPTLAMATDTSIEIGEWWFAIGDFLRRRPVAAQALTSTHQ